MGRFEVQGIVSSNDDLPYVQLRQLSDNDEEEFGFQVTPMEAREIAQNIQEAAANAIYDAAVISWAKEVFPNDPMISVQILDHIRNNRADHWGLPDRPEDWRK